MFPDSYHEFDSESQSMYLCETVANIKHEVISDSGSETSETPIYTDLSSPQFSMPAFGILKQEKVFGETFDSLLSWTSKHPEHWTHCEVLDWVYYVAEAKHFDMSKFYGEKYQSITGLEMCRMTREHFMHMDSNYGPILHDLFRSLVQKSKFSEPLPPESVNPDSYPFLDTTFPCLPVPYSSIHDAQSQNSDDLSVYVSDSGVAAVDIHGCVYDFDIKSKFDIPTNKQDDLGYVSAGSDMDTTGSNVTVCGSTRNEAYDVFNISDDEDLNTNAFSPFNSISRKRLSPTSSEEDMEERIQPHAQRRRINSTSKGNHLWEFIRDLLKDPKFNPSMLKWEDKEIGVFKFVQSESVATMWGRKKNNPGMTYEKLSRAMRFCRTAGYFGDVPKNGRFPKKLCFRFGPKAVDWK